MAWNGKYELSDDGIANMIKDTKLTINQIQSAVKEAIDETLEYGKEEVIKDAQIIRLPDERKAYEDSFVENANVEGYIVSGSLKTNHPKAQFVENGTGVVGSRHPNTAITGWQYDVNRHGEAGWNYLGTDGKYHHTKGMPAFKIYYTVTETKMRNKLKEILKKKLAGLE